MYKDYVNLLRKITHQFQNSGMEFDDLMSVANEAYVLALRSFDESRNVKFSTVLYKHVKNELINEAIKNKIKQRGRTEVKNIDWIKREATFNPETRVYFLSHLKSLSNEAQEVLKIVLSSPSDLLTEVGSLAPKKIRGCIYKKLKQENWPERKIWKIFSEIKGALK